MSLKGCGRKIGDFSCCTVVCGDCLELMKALPDKCVDAVITSPPYNQLNSLLREPTGMWGRIGGGRGFVENWQRSGYADDIPENEYQLWQINVFAESGRCAASTGSLFYNHQVRWRDGVAIHPVQWFKPDGWNLRQDITWDRRGGMMMNARMFCRFDERILWFVRSSSWKWNQESVGYGTVWSIPHETDKRHPVSYPEELPARCIRAATDAGDMVLDPFIGSGTTAVAAKKLGRHFLGFEISPEYCRIAEERIALVEAKPTLFEKLPEQMELR